MLVREAPAVYFEGKSKDADQVVEEFTSAFFYFKVDLPNSRVYEEMSDKDLLVAAEASGTFRLLDNKGENIYRQ